MVKKSQKKIESLLKSRIISSELCKYYITIILLEDTYTYIYMDDNRMLEQRDGWWFSDASVQLGLHSGLRSLWMRCTCFSFSLSFPLSVTWTDICDRHSWEITRFFVSSCLFRTSAFLFIIQRRVNGLVINMIVALANFVKLRRDQGDTWLSLSLSLSLSLFIFLWRRDKNPRQFSVSSGFA